MRLHHAKLAVALMTLVGIVFSVAIVVFIFIPTLNEDRNLSSQINDAHAELQAQYTNRRNLLSSINKAETARATMKALAVQFVPDGQELGLITAIETLATKTGVEEHISLKKDETDKDPVELRENFDLTLSGDYRPVLQMLVELERMPQLLITKSVLVQPSPGDTPTSPSFLSVVLHGLLVAPPPSTL